MPLVINNTSDINRYLVLYKIRNPAIWIQINQNHLTRQDIFTGDKHQHISQTESFDTINQVFKVTMKKRLFSKLLKTVKPKTAVKCNNYPEEFYEHFSLSKYISKSSRQRKKNFGYEVIEVKKTRCNLNKSSLKRKMLKRPYKCYICQAFFTTKIVLKEHRIYFHSTHCSEY